MPTPPTKFSDGGSDGTQDAYVSTGTVAVVMGGTSLATQMAFSFSFLSGIVISSESLEPASILQVFKLLRDGVREEEKKDIHLLSKMASDRVIKFE